MNLLGMYSDSEDSDDDNGKSSPTPPRPSHTDKTTASQVKSKSISEHNELSSNSNLKPTSASTLSSQKNQMPKKKKKLDISFLPDNIQAALTRGGDDSSDDDDDKFRTSKAVSESLRASSASNHKTSTSALFNLLPKPVNDAPLTAPTSSNHVQLAKTSQEKKEPSVVLESDNSSDDSDSSSSDSDEEPSLTVPSTKVHPAPAPVSSSSSSSSSSSYKSFTLPVTAPVAPSPADLSTTQHGASVTAPGPSLQPNATTEQFQHEHLASPHTQFLQPLQVPQDQGHQHILQQQYQQQQYQQQQYQQQQYQQQQYQQQQYQQQQYQQQQYQQQYQQQQYQQHQQPETRDQPIKNSRKRERDLQNHLLNGDVSAAMGLGGGNMLELRQDTTWDDTKYREQKQRQEELQKMFGNPSDSKMIAQPTKNQNRKHHINSMVFSAAEAELELLENRARRGKSKSETQAKYGW